MLNRLKYDKIKEVKKEKGSEIFLVKAVYNPETGEKEKDEEMAIDPAVLSERILVLQDEIAQIQTLQNRISTKDFDETDGIIK
jgi:uncharacterized small protein (DUF1192 family)